MLFIFHTFVSLMNEKMVQQEKKFHTPPFLLPKIERQQRDGADERHGDVPGDDLAAAGTRRR